MLQSNKIKILAIFIAIFASTLYFLAKSTTSKKDEVVLSVKDYLLNSFESELPGINKNLPHKIDDQTILLSISVQNGKVISVYQVDATAGLKLEKSRSALIKQECSDGLKKQLLDVDVNFINRYQDLLGKIVFELEIDNNICSIEK
jgi:hypothetical protein